MKGTAFSELALNPDPPSHRLHHARGDGQTQAGATIASCDGTVFLRKRLKDGVHLFRRYANAGIPHLKVQHARVSCNHRASHMHCDFAAFRELDGITHQVHQNLTQASGITDHRQWHVVCDGTLQSQTLVPRSQRQGLERFGNKLVQVIRNVLKLQLASLDLGKIQDVVDDAQQGFRRGFDDAHVLGLIVIEPGI